MATTTSERLEGVGVGVPARAAAMRLLDAVLRRGLPLDGAFDRATAGIDRPEDRALAHAIAAAVLRWLVDLDRLIDGATRLPVAPDAKARTALRIALAQALLLGTPPHAAISTTLPLVDGGPRRLVHGVFGALMRGGAALPAVPTWPDEVTERWQAAWGEAALDAARGLAAAPAPLDLALRDRGQTEALRARIGGESLAPGHLRLPAGTRLTELPGFAEGEFWAQDLAASIPGRLIGPGVDHAIDLCAAPGGKTLQLAAAGWRVTALDLSDQRLRRLHDNLSRTGLRAEVRVGDALTFTAAEPADAVLLDAPCSATGTFRRHPDVLHRVRPKAIGSLADRQRAMLARAALNVKPGGRLVYAVCSLEPAEGEAVAEEFLRTHASFQAEPATPAELPEGIAPDPNGFVRVQPGALVSAGGADGFFVARFRCGLGQQTCYFAALQ